VAEYEELLADRQRVLGPDHRDTLSTRAAVANWRGVAGDRAGAVAAYQELLADRERALGPDHRDTVSARAAVAHWRALQARSSERHDNRNPSRPAKPPPASTPDRGYLVKWRTADGTSQSLGPFAEISTAEEVCRWVERGKGTAIEVVRHPDE
jgi:hypothetical protein